MDNSSDLSRAAHQVTADPVPADHAGKGKEISPEKNQLPQVKLPSDSKRPSGMGDLDGDDDALSQLKDPTPADLADKTQPKVKLSAGMDDLDGDDDALRQLKDPIPADHAGKAQPEVKLPSSSSDPIKSGMDDIDMHTDDKDDELPQEGDPASLPRSNRRRPIRTGGMEDMIREGFHGFRFEILPGGCFRAEMQTPPGSMFGAMSLTGPLFGPDFPGFPGEDDDDEE